jgi:hypothetical protein
MRKVSLWTRCALLIVSFLLLSCGSSGPTNQATPSGPYFSLQDYFQQEIERLTKARQTVYKRITLDETVEEQQLEDVDFEAELSLFLKADINRPAWTDKYQIDSVLDAGQLLRLQYSALDTSLPTRQIRIHFVPEATGPTVQRVEIVSRTETALSRSDKTLQYDPQEGYTIAAAQGGSMTEDLQFLLEARFKPN